MNDWVFGYGSLAGPRPGTHRAVLHGARRAWTVAMDNSLDLPGYKRYLAADGSRPAVAVAFLDLVDDVADVGGRCRPVDADALAVLDRRERQYDRVDVTGRVEGVDGRVWTYVGRPDGRARAVAGRANGTLVVVRDYLRTVLTAFDDDGGRAGFDATTDPVDVPVWDLRRVDG